MFLSKSVDNLRLEIRAESREELDLIRDTRLFILTGAEEGNAWQRVLVPERKKGQRKLPKDGQ